MTRRTAAPTVIVGLAVALGIVAGCNSHETTGVTASVETAAVEPNDRVKFVGGSIVDRRTGRSFPMPTDMQDLYARVQEAQGKYAQLKERLDRDPRMRATRAQGRTVSLDVARARVARPLGNASGDSIDANVQSAEMMDICTDISLAIYDVDTTYQATVQLQTTALDEFFELLGVADVGGAWLAYATWRSASVDIIFYQVQLGFLASIYGAYGCWG